MDKFSGIRIWDYKKEYLENESVQEIYMEEFSKEGTSPQRTVLPDMMIRYQYTGHAAEMLIMGRMWPASHEIDTHVLQQL
ncbi:hypothetical protein TNCV_4402771 [Trichonephila clavipes]|uniref:Uncharacterized protein n=1 Tax=Trichonephila clavipes TaxID=2585209 RepID=A0A8X6S6M0_TRICX|nr:hypothetical protein TNCV_4402771 [Trichonephila clavipes]